MPTIAGITRKLIQDNVMIEDAISKEIVNHDKLARYLQEDIEKLYGGSVKEKTISAAITRYEEKMLKKEKEFDYNFFKSIKMDSGISYIVVSCTKDALNKIRNIYYEIDFNSGGILNVFQGNYELAIITNKEYKPLVLDLLQDATIKCVEDDQASISLIYSSNYSHTPGVFYNIARHLVWKNINVLTWLHTLSELTLIVNENDVTNCYDVLQKMLKEHEDNHNDKKKIQIA